MVSLGNKFKATFKGAYKNRKPTQAVEPPTKLISSLVEKFNNGLLQQTLSDLSKLLHHYPRSATLYNIQGATNARLGKPDAALEDFENALNLNPNLGEANNNMGNILKEQGKLEKAIKAYRKALLLKPDYAEAFYNMGNTYKEMKKFKSAISSYNRALSLNPNYAEAFYNKGLIQSYMNDTNAAIESYNQALKIKPSYVEALFKLGESFKLFGENNNAAKCFEAAVNLDETDAVGAKLHLATLGRSSTPSKTPEVFMKNFYKKRAQIWDNQSLDKYSGHLLIASAFGQANIKKESHILDLGCGTGSLANFLRPYAKSLVGIDLSHEMLAYARETKIYDLLIEKDIELYLAEKLDHYDIVVAAAVFIHFLNLERVFKLITRSLKKNGQFIFTVFESLKEDKHLNDFLMYSHSADYISSLVEYLDLKVIFRDRAIHEYHKETAIYSLVYVLQKTS